MECKLGNSSQTQTSAGGRHSCLPPCDITQQVWKPSFLHDLKNKNPVDRSTLPLFSTLLRLRKLAMVRDLKEHKGMELDKEEDTWEQASGTLR
ncbi:hypothetical protein VNO77_46212 [Canavalia gladiata]|uniref:Uncharacterized protein n=1 Tax=Canavalia gladiata TaxID=3824 RepID=A0AAN9PJ12_CANGL